MTSLPSYYIKNIPPGPSSGGGAGIMIVMLMTMMVVRFKYIT